jgi:uncharacterized protein YecT (DUF1311 family)
MAFEAHKRRLGLNRPSRRRDHLPPPASCRGGLAWGLTMVIRFAFGCLVAAAVTLIGVPAGAHTSKSTAREIAAIRDCAAKTRDDVGAGERNCLFRLLAHPCVAAARDDGAEANCFRAEAASWDALLNDNYARLLAQLDDQQTAKAKAMQHAWIAYRETTCGFYDDKIQGTLSIKMHASCDARETARRALLLAFFGSL